MSNKSLPRYSGKSYFGMVMAIFMYILAIYFYIKNSFNEPKLLHFLILNIVTTFLLIISLSWREIIAEDKCMRIITGIWLYKKEKLIPYDDILAVLGLNDARYPGIILLLESAKDWRMFDKKRIQNKQTLIQKLQDRIVDKREFLTKLKTIKKVSKREIQYFKNLH